LWLLIDRGMLFNLDRANNGAEQGDGGGLISGGLTMKVALNGLVVLMAH
jgi:hypothetical protein